MADDRPLTETDLIQYALRQDPLAALSMMGRTRPQPMTDSQSMGRILGESAAVGDPFGAIAIQRMFGGQIDPRIVMNETHGLANKQASQYRAIAEALGRK